MKKQLLKKVYGFIVTLMMFSISANAQIIYTDVIPDLTITQTVNGSTIHNLDINNDGITDAAMTASVTNFSNKAVKVSPSTGSQIAINSSTDSRTRALNINENISQTSPSVSSWLNTQNSVLYQVPLSSNPSCPRCGGGIGGNPVPFGSWSNPTDRYLAIRFSVGGNWYYGWVRVSVASLNPGISFTIRDYAYNATPNESILAGATSALGINENPLASKITIFPNPASNQLTISIGSLQSEVEVSIFDITGKIIYKRKESEMQNIEVNTTDFASGIYLVQIKSTDFIKTKKLVVKK